MSNKKEQPKKNILLPTEFEPTGIKVGRLNNKRDEHGNITTNFEKEGITYISTSVDTDWMDKRILDKLNSILVDIQYGEKKQNNQVVRYVMGFKNVVIKEKTFRIEIVLSLCFSETVSSYVLALGAHPVFGCFLGQENSLLLVIDDTINRAVNDIHKKCSITITETSS